MQLSQLPRKLVLAFAALGAKNTIPTDSQIGITGGAASLADGFPPLTRTPLSAGGIPPSGTDMNGILYELSDVVRWANAGGGYAYDAAFATDVNVAGYPKGARVMRSDGLGYWFNTVDNNEVDPEAAAGAGLAAGWVPDFTTGASAITMTNANVTLTALQYGKPVVVITGLLTSNLNLIFPAMIGEWAVINATTGAYTITCKTAAGTGAVADAGVTKIVGNGVDVLSESAKFSASTGAGLIGWIRSAVGAVATTLAKWLQRQTPSVFDWMTEAEIASVQAYNYGVDVSAACAAAILATSGKKLIWPAGGYRVSAILNELYLGSHWVGDGKEVTVIKAYGNYGRMLELQSTSTEFLCEGITFDQTGTTNRCVRITRALAPTFKNCGFRGDLVGSLVYSTGDVVSISACCKFDCGNSGTLGLEFDSYNQNCYVGDGTRFGGIGAGMAISNSSGPRVEGLKIVGAFFINTGGYNITIGNSYFTTITGCVLDQANNASLSIANSADCVVATGNYIGVASASVGTAVLYDSTAGGNHILANNEILGGTTCVLAVATVSARIGRLTIDGNTFLRASAKTLALDSVTDCIITSNQDGGTPTDGSWITAGTHASKGKYTFDNNSWHTVAPAAYDTASTYLFGNDRGIVGRASGSIAAGSSVSALSVAHGLFRTPKKVIFTLEGANFGAQWLTAKGSTNFTANWVTSGNATVNWDAEV